MRTLVEKKTSLIAIIAAAMMVFCAFAVALPADKTNAADTDSTSEEESGIDIDFSRLDIQKMSGLYAVSSIETPLKQITYDPAGDDTILVNADADASEIIEDIKDHNAKTLVVRDATVTFDVGEDGKVYNEIEIENLIIEGKVSFDASKLQSKEGERPADLGTLKTTNLAIRVPNGEDPSSLGIIVAEGADLLVKGTATVKSLERATDEILHVAFDVTADGGLTFSSDVKDGDKTYEWNLTIGGNYTHDENTHGAEYNVTFDTTYTKYPDTFGNLTLMTLKDLFKPGEEYLGNYNIALRIADLHGAVRTGNDPEPPAQSTETTETQVAEGTSSEPPGPDYSSKFDATGLYLTTEYTNPEGEIDHQVNIHYQINKYTYEDADTEKKSSVKVTFEELSMNLKANEEKIEDASINFDKFNGTASDEDGSNVITGERFHIQFEIEDVLDEHGFAKAVTEIIKAKKITKENVGKIAENLVGFTMNFSATSFSYVSPAPVDSTAAASESDDESETDASGANITLKGADFTASVDKQGILTFTSGIPDEKFRLADTVDITMIVGDITYTVHSDSPSLDLKNVNVAKVLKYIVGSDLSNGLNGGFADVVSDVMTKQVLDGATLTLKSEDFVIGYTKTAENATQKVSVQIGDKILEASPIVFSFTGTTMEIDADLTQLKVTTETTGTNTSGSSDLSVQGVKFKIGFEPQGIEEFAKLVQKSSGSEFSFADVLDYYRTVLSTDKAISWSSTPFTLTDLDYSIKNKGSNEDYYTNITTTLTNASGKSSDDPIFTMNHDKEKNELSAEFLNGSELTYNSFVADGLYPVINSSEIKDFKVTGVNKASLDDDSKKVVSFKITSLGASSDDTENHDAYFVCLQNVIPQLSVKDIRTIIEDEIPLWRTAIAADPETYFVIEGYHGDMDCDADPETGIDYPTSISYGHFDTKECIVYKLTGKEKVTVIPDTVSDKDQTLFVVTVNDDGSFIVDTKGEEEEGRTVTFSLRAGVLEDVAEVHATCTVNGTLAHKHCTVCLKNYINGEEKTAEQLVIPAPGHTVVLDAAVPATKESDGLSAGSHCSVCGAVLVAQEKIDKLPADATKTVIDTAESAVEISAADIKTVIDDDLALEVKNDKVYTELSAEILSYLSKTYGGDFHLGLEKIADVTSIDNEKIREAVKNSDAVISINLLMNGKEQHQLGSNATVALEYSLPSDKKASDMYVAYVDDSGNIAKVDSTYENGVLTFETDHFSYYAVMYNENDDSDGLSIAAWIALASVIVLAFAILVMGQRSASKKN